jgi:hypothetical protein
MEKERASGRTTRLIDQIIQDLFTKGRADVTDHSGKTFSLALKVIARLELEHPHKVKHIDMFPNKHSITITLDLDRG